MMQKDDLRVYVTFLSEALNAVLKTERCFDGVHHVSCDDGVLVLHSADLGIIQAFSPASGWSEVRVVQVDQAT